MKYLTVLQYAKENKTHPVNVWRWIRNGNIAKNDLKEVLVKRITISKKARPVFKSK